MLSKEEAYILSLVKEGDVLWTRFNKDRTVHNTVTKIVRNTWWSLAQRMVYGEYTVTFKSMYMSIPSKDKITLSASSTVEGVYMVTSSDGHIKYIDVKTFLKCMRHSPYFLNTKRLPKSFQENVINDLPEYAKKEVCDLVVSDTHLTQLLDDRVHTLISRCCK